MGIFSAVPVGIIHTLVFSPFKSPSAMPTTFYMNKMHMEPKLHSRNLFMKNKREENVSTLATL